MGSHQSSPEQPEVDTQARAALIQNWLANRQRTTGGPTVARADRSAPLRASSGQRRLWFQDQHQEVSGDRNIPFAWRITGNLSVDALFDALDLVVRRHEALRTAFHPQGTDLLQTVEAPYQFDRAVLDVTGDGPDRVAELVEAAAYLPFDLTAGRLLRALLYRTATDQHILLLVAPHLVVDDWSVGRLCSEIELGYQALSTGRQPDLPKLSVQYPDFAAWQRGRLEDGSDRPGIDYWLARLAGAPTVLDLPTDHPRPATSAHRAGWTSFELDADCDRSIERLCATAKATPFMVLLAAYGVVLARRSGARDILVGAPVTGRSLPELEPLIGFFVNTVPLRLQIDHTSAFTTLLRAVRDTVLAAMEHQDVPFDELVRQLAPERSSSTGPLVQVAFSVNAAGGEGLDLTGLTLTGYPVAGRSSRYDLVLALAPTGDGLRGEFIYDSELFDSDTADRFVADYLATVRAVVAHPDTPILAAGATTTDDSALLDGPVADFDADLNVADLVSTVADLNPDLLAVRAPDGNLTFGELDRHASALAARLGRHAAGAEWSVGVHLGRSRHLVVALLAAWKAGATFVPLDPSHPTERLLTILEDADIRVLVAAPNSALTATGRPLVDPATVTVDDARRRAVPHHPDCLAYTVYTSGTTGAPKGVGITYRNVANLIRAVASLAPAAGRLGGNVLAPGFDGWLWSTLIPLAYGRGVLLVDPLHGMDEVLAPPVEIITTTPSLLAGQPLPAAGTGPATVVVAGEPCPPALSARWSAGRRLLNAYGPTETTICATWADTAAGDDPATIGRPLPNYRVRVLDRYLRPVPGGTPGELFIAGAGVGRGYHNLPGQTAARFVPDPAGDGGRMYRTGDLVRVRTDGGLEFVGRADQQLKVRGFRVEPAEIERVAGSVPGVATAAVFRVPGPVAPALGLALVPTATAGQGLGAAVRDALETVLPDFMVPEHLVAVDRLPLTATGKTDEAALALLCAGPVGDANSGTTLSTPTEKLVATVWSAALGRPVDSVEDNFFELGGHSLIATRVVSTLREQTGLRLSMRQMFAQRTVGRLAAELDRLAAKRDASAGT